MTVPICTFITSVQESLWYLHWHLFSCFWVLPVPVGTHLCSLTSFSWQLQILSACDTPTPIPSYIFFGNMPIKGSLPMCEAWYLVIFWWLLLNCKNFLCIWGISLIFHIWHVNIFSYVVDCLLFCHFLCCIKTFLAECNATVYACVSGVCFKELYCFRIHVKIWIQWGKVRYMLIICMWLFSFWKNRLLSLLLYLHCLCQNLMFMFLWRALFGFTGLSIWVYAKIFLL